MSAEIQTKIVELSGSVESSESNRLLKTCTIDLTEVFLIPIRASISSRRTSRLFSPAELQFQRGNGEELHAPDPAKGADCVAADLPIPRS